MKDAILDAVTGVTGKWAKQRKAEERRANAWHRRHEVLCRSRRVTIKDAAYQVMEEAYMKASARGSYPANARQIMYAARPQILEITDRQTLNDQYFTQSLLPHFIAEHPGLTADWDVVYDARGHFREPHTDEEVPLGTLEVRGHLSEIATGGKVDHDNDVKTDPECLFPTVGPENRYHAILFIEKEGFMPLFEKANIANRFDIAIMSSKGQSVVACRKLADEVCGPHGIPLLLLRDFDIAGFNIAHVLQTNTDRYTFEYSFRVVDLGIRLDDVEKYGLLAEPVSVPGGSGSSLQVRGATPEEIEFLCDGQRVELNAFASDDLVEWLEAKLTENGISKLVPKIDVLKKAYRRAARNQYIEDRLPKLEDQANDFTDGLKKPRDLKRKVSELLKATPTMPWDVAVAQLVEEAMEE